MRKSNSDENVLKRIADSLGRRCIAEARTFAKSSSKFKATARISELRDIPRLVATAESEFRLVKGLRIKACLPSSQGSSRRPIYASVYDAI